MRRKAFHDYNQIEIPFEEAMWIIDARKREREEALIQDTKYFRDHDAERAFLLRVTFEITDKDFEYFCEYILKKHYYLKEYRVTGGEFDGGQDIYGKDENGKEYSFQCKQWASLKILPENIGEYLGQIYRRRKENPHTKFVYVTTSFLSKHSKEFLKENNIEYVDNVKLVSLCRKYGLFKMEKWEAMKKDIDKARLKYNRSHFVTTPLSKLSEQRGFEIPHHFPKSMHLGNVKVLGVPV